MSSAKVNECTACGGKDIYVRKVNANGGYGPFLLRGLGAFFRPAKMNIYICASCGHMEYYADREAVGRLKGSSWTRLRG